MILDLESPFPIHSLPALWRWISAARSHVADDFFPGDLDSFIDQWMVYDKAGRRTWGVRRDGELGGVITSMRTGPINCDLHCVFERRFWGHAVTLESLRRVCEELFSETPGNQYQKIGTMAFADNRNLSAFVKLLGGSREGLHRNHTRRGGKLTDLISLGLEKERFYVVGARRVQEQQLVLDEPVNKLVVQHQHEQRKLWVERIGNGDNGNGNGRKLASAVAGAGGGANVAR